MGVKGVFSLFHSCFDLFSEGQMPGPGGCDI